MKNLKILIYSLIFLMSNYFAAYSDITASSPTNIIQSIANASSYTSLDQNNAQAANEIQNVTDTLLDGEEIRETVELEAEVFGSQLNETEDNNEEQLVNLNSSKGPELEFPEPNLDTIVYDTGLMTLTANTSAQYNGGAGDDTNIFSGEQQARVKVYIDFKRQKQWGSIESHITLTNENGGETMINVTEGGARTVTELPVTNSQLTRVISSATTKPLNIDNAIDPTFANNEEPYMYDKHSINSLLQDNTTPTLGLYLGDDPKTTQSADFADLQKSVSHGSGGDKGVLVGAKFSTGAGGTLGTSTASFEVSNVGACASATGCTVSGTNEIATRITSIVRLEATKTTTATKFIEE